MSDYPSRLPGSRRLLHLIPCLTTGVIEDYIRVATRTEINALRPAVCQYFGGETLIRVHTSVSYHYPFNLVLY